MPTIRCSGDRNVMQWTRDHGLDPQDFSAEVTLNHDGTVVLRRFLLDGEGKHYSADGRTVATTPTTITPRRPFPVAA